MAEEPPETEEDIELAGLAEKYCWSIHGRGLSTSLGVHTRRLIKQAYTDGYKACRSGSIKVSVKKKG